MHGQLQFWWTSFKRGCADFWRYVRSTLEHLMWTLLQIAFAFLILRFVPALGDLRAEVGDAVLLALAVIATAAVRFVGYFLAAPGRTYGDMPARVAKLEGTLQLNVDSDAIVQEVQAIYWEGLNFYQNEASYEAWQTWPQEWAGRARAVLARYYDAATLFEFDKAKDGAPKIHKSVGINYPGENWVDLAPVLEEMRAKLRQVDNAVHRYPVAALNQAASR